MKMDNMRIYSQVASTPKEAQKTIAAGRLKGFTDINPMHRIKLLTQCFGPCGIGWKYTITSQRLEKCDNGEVKAFVDIGLFIKDGDKWSDAIPGIGGSSFVSNEARGVYVNDECFKSALSDAIGTACKNLGMSSDIYYSQDRTKYRPFADKHPEHEQPKPDQHEQSISTAPSGVVPNADAVKQLELIVASVHDVSSANLAMTRVDKMGLIPEAAKQFKNTVYKKGISLGLKFDNKARLFREGDA